MYRVCKIQYTTAAVFTEHVTGRKKRTCMQESICGCAPAIALSLTTSANYSAAHIAHVVDPHPSRKPLSMFRRSQLTSFTMLVLLSAKSRDRPNGFFHALLQHLAHLPSMMQGRYPLISGRKLHLFCTYLKSAIFLHHSRPHPLSNLQFRFHHF